MTVDYRQPDGARQRPDLTFLRHRSRPVRQANSAIADFVAGRASAHAGARSSAAATPPPAPTTRPPASPSRPAPSPRPAPSQRPAPAAPPSTSDSSLDLFAPQPVPSRPAATTPTPPAAAAASTSLDLSGPAPAPPHRRLRRGRRPRTPARRWTCRRPPPHLSRLRGRSTGSSTSLDLSGPAPPPRDRRRDPGPPAPRWIWVPRRSSRRNGHRRAAPRRSTSALPPSPCPAGLRRRAPPAPGLPQRRTPRPRWISRLPRRLGARGSARTSTTAGQHCRPRSVRLDGTPHQARCADDPDAAGADRDADPGAVRGRHPDRSRRLPPPGSVICGSAAPTSCGRAGRRRCSTTPVGGTPRPGRPGGRSCWRPVSSSSGSRSTCVRSPIWNGVWCMPSRATGSNCAGAGRWSSRRSAATGSRCRSISPPSNAVAVLAIGLQHPRSAGAAVGDGPDRHHDPGGVPRLRVRPDHLAGRRSTRSTDRPATPRRRRRRAPTPLRVGTSYAGIGHTRRPDRDEGDTTQWASA